MTWKLTDGERGPEWSGFDSLYNPRHAQRWTFVRLGIGLIVIHYVLVWIFASLTYSYLNAEHADRLVLKSFKFVFLPGVVSLVYAGWFCRKYLNRSWQLTAAFGVLNLYRPQHWLKNKIAWANNDSNWFSLTIGLLLPFELDHEGPEWCVLAADVARVETDATARWEPARPGIIADNPVSGDEVQAFLFMADGSRRVIASVHAGREDMAKLTHSIRSWLDHQRQTERVMDTQHRAFAALESADGFNI
jgi:hypothetical protein